MAYSLSCFGVFGFPIEHAAYCRGDCGHVKDGLLRIRGGPLRTRGGRYRHSLEISSGFEFREPPQGSRNGEVRRPF